MDCRELERLLPAYADGEFEGSECAEVEAHLEACPSCRDEVAAVICFRSFLQQKLADAPLRAPERLRNRVSRDISRERARDQVRRFGIYSALAAGLVAVASTGYLVRGNEYDPGSVLHDAVDKHARRLPLEVDAKGGDVEGWFRGKVDFRVRAPRFRNPDSPRLVGARLANVLDRQAAYLVYGGDESDRRTTLLVFPGEMDLPEGRRAQIAGRDVVMANERGYNVAVWKQSGIVYSLVSDLDERDILRLVSEVEGLPEAH